MSTRYHQDDKPHIDVNGQLHMTKKRIPETDTHLSIKSGAINAVINFHIFSGSISVRFAVRSGNHSAADAEAAALAAAAAAAADADAVDVCGNAVGEVAEADVEAEGDVGDVGDVGDA